MLHKILILTIALLLPWVIAGTRAQDSHEDFGTGREAHEEHDHDDPGHEDGQDAHDHDIELTDHEDHSKHDGQVDELTVELSPEAVALADLQISTVSHGRIARVIELPGEVEFNEDRLVHIAPRFAGIALQANYRVGDFVDAGDVMAIVESNESMNSYAITAPMSGRVIERHITPGEFVSTENRIYVVADLTSVWVNLAVYPRDCNHIRRGQAARIAAVGDTNSTNGTIDYISSIIDFRTRSATARVTLPNPDNTWRPGTFVQAAIATEEQTECLAVEKNAVQYLDERSVVFVVDGPNRFRPVEVVTGESDANHIEIVGGLNKGTEYVSRGAFELKARIVTSNLDPHAGHNH